MNDVVVQFARLWGQREAWWTSSVEEEDIQKELKEWDSQEMYEILVKWAEEYLAGDQEDTVEFFDEKVKSLIKKD